MCGKERERDRKAGEGGESEREGCVPALCAVVRCGAATPVLERARHWRVLSEPPL